MKIIRGYAVQLVVLDAVEVVLVDRVLRAALADAEVQKPPRPQLEGDEAAQPQRAVVGQLLNVRGAYVVVFQALEEVRVPDQLPSRLRSLLRPYLPLFAVH